MVRDWRRVAAVVVLVCAFGLVAATVDTGAVPEGDGGSGSVEGDLDFLEFLDLSNERSDGGLCPAFLNDPGGLAAALLVVGAGMLAGARLLDSWIPALVVGGPIALWSIGCSSLVGSLPGTGWVHGPVTSPALVLAAILLGLLGTLGFLWITSDDAGELGEARAVEPDRPVDLDAVATAAGTAAARIDGQADVENEVYRAWLAMTKHLGVGDPETTTPAEFERLALESGMKQPDVSTLTRLFRDVRYGERDPAPRAERAIAALERIERTYAEDPDRTTEGDE